MRAKFIAVGLLAAAVTLAGAVAMPAGAAEPSIPDNSPSDAAPNLLPADASTPTAASSDIEDVRVTAQIRSALSADKSLSALAHSVNISTNKQAVILRGQVKPDEKDRVEALASQYAGTRQVVDQLLVKDL
jgi:hyperosmotically inducible periplasmic protein